MATPLQPAVPQRRRTLVASLVVALIGTAAVGAPSATAAPRDGRCDPGEFCYSFNSGFQGAVSDFAGSVADYGTRQPGCYEFRGGGAGSGRCIKNQAAAARNRTGGPVTVYFNTGYAGRQQVVPAGATVDLVPGLKNENASHRFGAAGPATPTPTTPSTPVTTPTPTPTPTTPAAMRGALSSALYGGRSGGRITCGYDGYTTTPGAHEGIDIKRSEGSPVLSLSSGTVTSVAAGRPGRRLRTDLSTIAIYDGARKRTVVYLHTAPLGSLRTGQRIRRGQRIGSESWRGVTTRGAGHTHVEVRTGRQTNATTSVGDPDLLNPNPAPYWISLGYQVR
ncbi:peptidoglycan DD-metalloendopeptidase family protein [Patulibacter sp.]|uniref:peptidoglycan DD-metalloendopeptidase family protein n=1 Tax=Patulibacter sp. TaxID=1912859 RepID=UPI0027239D6F|nr:peptidoglycan DD-metalloendopeptidase family protein [Patulibacter sp.]MDO9407743.1 peptidoglycan DD-metalloendopeptidase family protein [Patulibacter sp.]